MSIRRSVLLAGALFFALICEGQMLKRPSRDELGRLNQAQFDLALKLAGEGKFREANELLLNLYERTRSPRVLLEGARVLYVAGEYAESEKLFRAVLELEPPMMVQEKIARYLDDITTTNGRFDFSVGLIRDTNPRAMTSAETITLFGQTYAYNPGFDTTEKTGMSYSLVAEKSSGLKKEYTWGLTVNGAKFQDTDYDRTSVEESVSYRLSDSPRLSLRLASEQFFLAGDYLYNMPSVSLRHLKELSSETYWTNDIKAGLITYKEFDYLGGMLYSYNTGIGRPIMENVILGAELGLDSMSAQESAYSYNTKSLSLLLNVYVPRFFIKYQLRASLSRRDFESEDPFFGNVRSDQKSGVFLNIVKSNWRIYGMAPVLDIGYEKNSSSIELFSYKRVISTLSFKKMY
jgi:tetratricopeptide (TPR) repeat protein